jgi:hypothetical protein
VAQVPWGQLIVTVSAGASLTSPRYSPLTTIVYCLPGVAFRAVTTRVVTKEGYPHDWAKEVESKPSLGDTVEIRVTFCVVPETNETVTCTNPEWLGATESEYPFSPTLKSNAPCPLAASSEQNATPLITRRARTKSRVAWLVKGIFTGDERAR